MSRRAVAVAHRTLVALLISILLASLIAPGGVLAADPSADPAASPSPSATADPAASPSPSATADPAPAPTPMPDATASPEVTDAPSGAPTPDAPTPDATPIVSPDPSTAAPASPTIVSDLADYAPGSLVTLTGSGWQPGESVHIYVNDDWGSSWSRSVDVIADADGAIQDQFNLPNWFVATYRILATTDAGISATATFTDSQPGSVTIAAPTSVTVIQGGTAAFGTLTIVQNGNSDPCTLTLSASGLPSGAAAVFGSNPLNMTNANVSTSVSVTTSAGTPVGTYTGISVNASKGSNCQGPAGSVASNAVTLKVNAANNAPVASGQSLTTDEDTAKVITLSGTDADGNDLTFSIGTSPAKGSLGALGAPSCSVSAGTSTCTSTVTYTPTTNLNGSDSFTFRVNDGTVESAAATVSISITPVDDAPVAVDDSTTVTEDAAATAIDVLANDTDIDGGPKSVASVTQPTHGAVVITGGGSGLNYQPAANDCNGGSPTDDFTYTLNGGSSATVRVTVTCVDDAPVADDETISTDEDTAVDTPVSTLLAGDDDVDSAALTVTGVSGANGGTAVLEDNGTLLDTTDDFVRFTPTADLCGPAAGAYDYTVSDGSLTDTGHVTVDITCVNDAPVVKLSGDFSAVDEGTTRTYTYSVSDVDNASWTVTETCGTDATYIDDLSPNSFGCTFLDGPGSSIVDATADDGSADNATGSDPHTVSVANVAPTVSLSGPTGADEGQTKSYAFTTSDPGQDTFGLVSTACGVGNAVTNVDFDATTGAGSFDCTFADGPSSPTVSVVVEDSDGAASDPDTVDVTVANVKPTVTFLTGATSADEGQTKTYTYSVSDPGDDSLDVAETCTGAATYGDDLADASFTCTFPDGPASAAAQVTANDEDAGPPTVASRSVSVANVAPTVSLSGPTGADEGQTKSYAFTTSDPGQDTFGLVSTACGVGNAVTNVDFDATTGAGSFDCTFADGPSSPTVSVVVEDSDGAASDPDTVDVTVANVKPTVDAASITVDPVTGAINASMTYSDVGVVDTETAIFEYWLNGTRVATHNSLPTLVSSGTVSDTYVAAPGCYSIEVRMWVADKDGAEAIHAVRNGASSTVDIYRPSFQAPIKDNERNLAKYGNVVPIKVTLTSSCSPGTTVTTPTLHLTIADGNVTDVDPDTTPIVVAESASSADTGTAMRVSGGSYIYNFSTKKLNPGQDYTIRVRSGSPTGGIILRALFQPKK